MLRCLEAKSRTPALYIIRVYFFREIFGVGVWELSWARYTVVCRVREKFATFFGWYLLRRVSDQVVWEILA